MTPTVCFIVPTLRRPVFLRKCLVSLASQTLRPTKVLVGLRQDDTDSHEILCELANMLPLQAVEAQGVGVIGSMTSCLLKADEQFVALVDDDVELPPHWLETMIGHLSDHPHVLAAAGRDYLQDHPEFRRDEKRLLDVGRLHWYGRITGNHHRGGGEPRTVDILRGSNCLFRGAFLREAGFEQELRGQGAQVNWELALAFQARKRGARFFYDPRVEVIHHVAPRSDADVLHRGGWNATATSDCAFNETLVVRKHLRGFPRMACLLYQLLIGSSLLPGAAHVARHLWRRDDHVSRRLAATLAGRTAALRHAGRA